MKKRLLLLTISLTALISAGTAGITDSLSIGAAGSYTSYNNFRGEIYLKASTRVFNRTSEIKFGINNQSYTLDFDHIPDLQSSSFGIFVDLAVYPFNKGFFTGIRWDLITFNRLSPGSVRRIEEERNYGMTSLYTGSDFLLQLGYQIPVTPRFSFKLYGQTGIQQFKISNIPDSWDTIEENLIMEEYYRFIWNINLGIEFRL